MARINVRHNPLKKTPNKTHGRAPKLKRSIFMVTINTNLRCGSRHYDSCTQEDFVNGLHEVFDDPKPFIKYLEPGHGYERVEKIDVTVSPEIGPKKGLLHAHIIIDIHHRTKAQIDYVGLKDLLVTTGTVPASGFHFYVKLIKDNFGDAMSYIEKTRAYRWSKGKEVTDDTEPTEF